MTRALNRRLEALEQQHEPDHGRLLPTVVDDDTSDAELERLRAAGVEAYRLREFVQVAI